MREGRAEAFADAVRQQLGDDVDRVTTQQKHNGEFEVYVRVVESTHTCMPYMDEVCALAFDHGLVPVGMIENASRFQRRDTDELRV